MDDLCFVKPGQLVPPLSQPVGQSIPDHPLFAGLSRAQKRKAQQAFRVTHLTSGDTLAEPASERSDITFLLRGALRVDIPDRTGAPRAFSLTFPGDMLCPKGHRVGRGQVTALCESEVLHCDGVEFAGLLAAFPRLTLNYTGLLQRQLDDVRAWHVLLGRKTAAERVAALILRFWEGQGRAPEVILYLNREGLGQLVGLTLETVSRRVRALEEAGIINVLTPSRILLRNPLALRNAAGDSIATRLAA